MIDKIDVSPESEIRVIVNTRIKAVRDKNLKAAMVPIAPDVVSFDVVNPLYRNGSEQLTERPSMVFIF
jgi:ketosteroid isomerase-like protein